MKVRKGLSFVLLFAIFFIPDLNALANEPVCILEDIPRRIKAHIRKYPDHSRWRALDIIQTPADIIDADKCFVRWAKQYTMHSQHEIVRLFRGFDQSTETPVYAQASNFGYAKVYFKKIEKYKNLVNSSLKEQAFFIKESFYIDIYGAVYTNPLFIINYDKNGNLKFFSYNYINDSLDKKTKCMRCHKERHENNFLFGRY